MIVFLNDRFLPAADATVSAFDRGFLYGDGLFETIRVADTRPLLWSAHLQRLASGLSALDLKLRPPHTLESLLDTALELIRQNNLSNAILRLAVSRGPGPRGYSPRHAGPPTLILSLSPAPPLDAPPPLPKHLATSRYRIPAADPLTPFKTASRLLNVLARAEAEAAGADDALLLNTEGHLAEAGAANLFWLNSATLHTPGLTDGALAGVTRRRILELARGLGWTTRETTAPPDALRQASGVFVTFASLGIVEVDRLDRHPLPRDPRIATLRAAYIDHLRTAP